MSASFHKHTKLLTTVAIVASLGACDGLIPLKHEKAIAGVNEDNKARIEAAAGKTGKAYSTDPLTISDDVWVGNHAVRMRRGQPLPGKFETDSGFALTSASPMSLGSIASQIANSTNIPVRMGDMALSDSGGGGGKSDDYIKPSDNDPLSRGMNVYYQGSLSTFLDQVASQFDISWRFDGQTIFLYRYETKTFTIEAMPGKASLDDNFDTGSSSSSGSSGGSSSSSDQDIKQKNQMQAELDYWKDLEASIKGMLGGQGIVTLMPSSGTITVSAHPDKLQQISRFMEGENNRLGRQVAIDVVVYSVTMRDTDSYGMNLSGVFNNEVINGKNTVFTLGGPTAITDPSALTQGSLSVALLGNGWNATAVPKALSTLGNVAEVTRAPIVTLNNRPASRKITVDRTYAASTTAPVKDSGGNVTAGGITPGTVSTGFVLQLLPRILDDGRVLLQYSIKISDLVGDIRTFTSGTGDGATSIQVPEVNSKIFVQQAVMQNGSTLVLAGFDKNKKTGSAQGIGAATNWLLGGGISNDNNREQIVITISPHQVTPERGSSQGT